MADGIPLENRRPFTTIQYYLPRHPMSLSMLGEHKRTEDERNQHKMKAIRMRIQKSSRPLVILLATVVAIITSMVVANATQTITTPNAAFISYSLAAGANSAAITPAGNRSVLIMGCATNGDNGVGQVTLLRHPGSELDWVGFDIATGALTRTASGIAGVHIVYIGGGTQLDIQTASADTILVHNGNPNVVTGNVTLIW